MSWDDEESLRFFALAQNDTDWFLNGLMNNSGGN